jgi:hypothetical protein
MTHKSHLMLMVPALVLISTGGVVAQAVKEGGKPGQPAMSGFFSFSDASSQFQIGFGNVQKFSCTVGTSTQPAVYAGNMLLDCDAEVPHNETSIAVDPNNPSHAVGAYHSYQLSQVGNNLIAHIIGTTSVSFDGGQDWQEVVPPITPYQFTGDPALAFDANGRLYFANIADNEGQGGGNFTGPDVVVAHSDDGGLSWSGPVTVATGMGNAGSNGLITFNDKEYVAADRSASSAFRNRAYVTWTRFQFKFSGGASPTFFRSPISVSSSDDGQNWSDQQTISGFSPACTATFSGSTGECDIDQDSYPTVAPGGKTYVSFENFNTPAENQLMVVSSGDGGRTWSAPVRVDTIFDINFPQNVDGRDTLTGCQYRVGAAANSAADPSDPTGNTLYVTWADNRNGTKVATNTDVFLARSADGGRTWTVRNIDSSPNDQFFPWVAVGSEGRVDVGYMDRSYSSGQSVCQYGFTLTRLTFSGAGRLTSKVRTRVDTGLSDPGHSRWFSASTNGNGRFIGDYNGLAVGSDGATWSLWTDQRALVENPPSPTRNHGQHAVGTRTP